MSLLFWKPPLAKFLFLIYHLVSHISAINHLRDKFDQVELRLDGASFTDTHDNIDFEGVSQHVFREFAAGLSSRTDLVKHDRVSPHHVHEVMFAIQQRNLDILTEMLHDIADPDSSNYGQHKTRAEIEEISSNPESCDAVVRFLEESGATVVSQSHHGEYVTAHAPISLWENLLNTEFFVFHHTHPKNDVIAALVRAEEYSVPKELHEHVASVLQTIQMPLALWGYPVMFGASNVTFLLFFQFLVGNIRCPIGNE